ncbi:MAG: bifunctional UDP-N-acetylglucosamine diphosphorylase/glucosamine-1-phosphate N-acetyltransferase GlmU [Burkholderiales bacterium]
MTPASIPPLDIVILAAGKGSRMHSALPKVLHPVGGKPLLAHVIAAAEALAPRRIVVVYGHGGEQVPAAIGRNDIVWVQQEQQLGTGHAVLQALPHLQNTDGLTLILYGDVPLIDSATLQRLTAAADDRAVALLTAVLERPEGYGRIVRDGNGLVRAIVEHKDADDQQRAIREINTGIMVLPNKRLERWLKELDNSNSQGEYYLTDVIAAAASQNVAIHTAQPQHAWETLGVNDKRQLAELERTHQHNTAQALLRQGVSLRDPQRLDVRGELRCGRDVEIDINCLFEGRVDLGDNVSIGANCILRNVTVARNTRIAPFTLLEDSTVDEDCRLGPFARLRPGSRLAQAVHIGNFVEIKNSQVGQGSKINHLSYVGDSEIGKNVNIGAGTITCNYDGANKHKTIIEDDAFIGSDTQLVAPVTVKRGATIGAGSTITKETPADALTLSRARQVTVSGWLRPKKK